MQKDNTVLGIPAHIWNSDIFSYLDEDFLIFVVRLVCKTFNLENTPLFHIRTSTQIRLAMFTLHKSIVSVKFEVAPWVGNPLGSKKMENGFGLLTNPFCRLLSRDLVSLKTVNIDFNNTKKGEYEGSLNIIKRVFMLPNITNLSIISEKIPIRLASLPEIRSFKKLEKFEYPSISMEEAKFFTLNVPEKLKTMALIEQLDYSVSNLLTSNGSLVHMENFKMGSKFKRSDVKNFKGLINIKHADFSPKYNHDYHGEYATEFDSDYSELADFGDYLQLFYSKNMPNLRYMKFVCSGISTSTYNFMAESNWFCSLEDLSISVGVPPIYEENVPSEIFSHGDGKIYKVNLHDPKSRISPVSTMHKNVNGLLKIISEERSKSIRSLETRGLKWKPIVDDITKCGNLLNLKRLIIMDSKLSLFELSKIISSKHLPSLIELKIGRKQGVFMEEEEILDRGDEIFDSSEETRNNVFLLLDIIPNTTLKTLSFERVPFVQSLEFKIYIMSGVLTGIESISFTATHIDNDGAYMSMGVDHFGLLSRCTHFSNLRFIEVINEPNVLPIIAVLFRDNNLPMLNTLKIVDSLFFVDDDDDDDYVGTYDWPPVGNNESSTNIKIVITESSFEGNALGALSAILHYQRITELDVSHNPGEFKWSDVAIMVDSTTFPFLKIMRANESVRSQDNDMGLPIVFDRCKEDLEILHLKGTGITFESILSVKDYPVYSSLREFVY